MEGPMVSAEELWSFQPLQGAKPPEVSDPAWAGNPIDRFVKARLEAVGLPPANPASPGLLLRRLHLELTGLPPTPEEVDGFDRDDIGKVVDQLLDSPAFGDRWARHWLDLTAYADTIGVGRSIPATEAWRYRDYVIDAFNSDKPFNEFVRQQISGDIKVPSAPGIPEEPRPNCRGHRCDRIPGHALELVGGDKKQLRMDVVDRQVNRIGKAFLGMTLECARCHGHKFDPISQEDYFALAGIFRSTVTLNGRINGVFSNINKTQLPESPDELIVRAEKLRAHQAGLAGIRAAQAKLQKEIKEIEKKINAAKKELEETVTGDVKPGAEEGLTKLAKQKERSPRTPEVQIEGGGLLHYIRHTVKLSYARSWTPGNLKMPQSTSGQCAPTCTSVIPRGFPKGIAPKDKPAFTRGGSGRVQLAEWLVNEKNPLTARVWVNRVWYHLFGGGLVRLVYNFGVMGEKPSHPELLDYLAAEFMKDGWSTKKLIRRIVLTRAWQQASTNTCACRWRP